MIDKEEHFRLGKYTCQVPWVSHLWRTADWIKHIDLNGKWLYD